MSVILGLAKSGFGKTFSLAQVPELNHKGLDPKETYIISTTSKNLTFKGSAVNYKTVPVKDFSKGNRVITNDPEQVATLLTALSNSPYKNVVIDDFNYLMQDFYMDNALKGGWDTPKKIGYFMGKIFKAMDLYHSNNSDKNLIILAHGEEVPGPDGRIYVKMKTTGNMVDSYVTPEGKFEIVLIGISTWDTSSKRVVKQYLTNENEHYSSAKSPYGMFEELVPNDLGLIVDRANEYYNAQ